MQKLRPKGTPVKKINIKLTLEERARFKAFCKAIGFNYSEMFRAMSNGFIKQKIKEMDIDIKCHEPQIDFNDQKTDEQLNLWKK